MKFAIGVKEFRCKLSKEEQCKPLVRHKNFDCYTYAKSDNFSRLLSSEGKAGSSMTE